MKAIERVKEFLRQYGMSQGVDQDIIKMIHVDPHARMSQLRVKDLMYLVGYTERTHVVVCTVGDRIHVYGPYTYYKAGKAREQLLEEAVRDKIAVTTMIRPIIDTERKNQELEEKQEDRRRER